MQFLLDRFEMREQTFNFLLLEVEADRINADYANYSEELSQIISKLLSIIIPLLYARYICNSFVIMLSSLTGIM